MVAYVCSDDTRILPRFDTLKEKALDAIFQLNSVLCCQSAAKVKIGGRSFTIVKVLGEGGFSFVYLAQDVDSGVSVPCLSSLHGPITRFKVVCRFADEFDLYRGNSR